MPSWPSGSAWPGIQLGGKTGNALTFRLDRSVRPGHTCILVTKKQNPEVHYDKPTNP